MTSETGSERDSAVSKAKQQARTQLPKRFYKTVSIGETDGGFAVLLDGRPVKTPAKKQLAFPKKPIAEIVAGEFEAQRNVIDPKTMPATRLSNTAIDGVAEDPQSIVEDMLRFASNDLLCYRAGRPQQLVDNQNAAWDPVIDWVRRTIGADMVLAEGVVHVDQKPEAIAAIGARLRNFSDPFSIAGLHVMTTLTGSMLLSLVVAEGFMTAEAAWDAAHVDEDWNVSQWGRDSEEAARRSSRRAEMMIAANFVLA